MAQSIPEIGPLRAPQGAHLLLSVGVPALFWNLAVFWASGWPPSWPLAPLALLYAVVLGFWSPWRQRTRQGPLLKLWFWVMATLLLYAALALAEGAPWPQTFSFQGLHLLWFAPAFLQGQMTALWADQLTSRARLYQLIEGIPSGRQLEERVRDFQLDADFSRGNEATLSASLAVMAALAVCAATFSPFGRGGLSWALAGGFTVLCLFLGAVMRIYRREMEALMYGHRFSLAQKWQPLAWSALLLTLSAAGAGAMLLLGGPWFDWNSLFQGRHEAVPVPPVEERPLLPPPSPEGSTDYTLAVLLALVQNLLRLQNLAVVVEWTIRLAGFLLPCLVAAYLLWPLVRWFLAGGRETRGLLRRWLRLLAGQWEAFLRSLGQWRRPAVGLPLEGQAREWLASLFRRPAPGRRVPYPAVVEAFLKLAGWAEPVASYRQGETTREYLEGLILLLPLQGGELVRVRDLLEQELFGPEPLTAAERKAFLGLVAGLTAVPPSHDDPQALS